MSERIVRPYNTETVVSPGTGVVQGSAENTVRSPDVDGSGDYLGVYEWDPHYVDHAAGERVGVVLSGLVKVKAGDAVSAGKRATLAADASGAFVDLPEAAGTYRVCGTFLQSGQAGEFVDMIVERGSVTVAGA